VAAAAMKSMVFMVLSPSMMAISSGLWGWLTSSALKL
jgi:hypothetical protein